MNNINKSNNILFIPFITLACFDKLLRRLIITTKQNEIQLWNFNSGECLQIIQPQLPTMKNNIPINNFNFTALSCDDVFLGIRKSLRKFIFFGGDNGFVFGLQDCDVIFIHIFLYLLLLLLLYYYYFFFFYNRVNF